MDKTIIESDTTVRESTHFPETTQRDENSEDIRNAPRGHLIQFQDYTMVEQLPTTGGEADVYIISKNENEFILKLYRHEMKPSREMVERLVQISNQYPEDIIRIYEIAKDEKLNRWYELQEFAKLGTLKNLITNDYSFTLKNIHKIVEEMALILKTIHNENIIHRDIKPDNILVRTKDPLDLIITDFGISSVLDEEMSKKMTTKSGTKIYFAPESFSGVIGKEVDYWALGMIILEILENGNVLSGIHEGMIAHEIFTKGIKIPSTISENLQLLLKGLLARDPKQRWNHEQIFKWLSGDKNIPTFYSFNEVETHDIKPYIFENEKFFDIKNLLAKMYTDEYYEKAKAHILRGYVTKWLEETGQYDNAVVFNIEKKINIDLNLFNIYNHFIQTNDFLFMGKLITVKNLLKFTDESVNKDILNYLQNGTIFEAYEKYIHHQNSDKNDDLYNFLSKSQFCKSDISIHYLGRIFLDENSLAYQLIKNDTNNKLIQDKVIKKIFDEFCNSDLIYSKSIVKTISNNTYIIHNEGNKLAISSDELGIFFSNKNDLSMFLNHQDAKDVENYFKVRDDVQSLENYMEEGYIENIDDIRAYWGLLNIKRKSGLKYPKTYLFIFRQSNNDDFIDDIKEYIPENTNILQKLAELKDIDVIYTHQELFTFEQLIRSTQSEIIKRKEAKETEKKVEKFMPIIAVVVIILVVWFLAKFWLWILGIGGAILFLMAMFGGS